MEKNVVTAA